MDSKKKRRIMSLYNDLVQFYFNNSKKELDFEDKPLTNFLEIIYPVVKVDEFYCDDIFISSVIWHLENLCSEQILESEKLVDQLIKEIRDNFSINKEVHYLIFPLQGSGLKQDIRFSKFSFLIEKKEEEMIKQISMLTNIDKARVLEALEHTKKSRSKDFLRSNIMIIETENQTENVRYSVAQFAQCAIDFLHLIHSAFAMEHSFLRCGELMQAENKHVAILSKDNWRCGHGFKWNARLQCKMDLDFMADDQYQKIFNDLFYSFALNKNMDDLSNRFLNSFLLYSRGVTQKNVHKDNELALLLFITAIEALIVEGKQEKRLRLSAIISRIITIDGFPQYEVAGFLNEIYKKRNDFVHAGQTPRFTSESKDINLLERITALLILKYFKLDFLSEANTEQARINSWLDYLDNVFDEVIFGK